LDGQGVLVADVDVSLMGPYGVGPDDHPFEHAVGVSLEEASVHVGPGVSLVGVADHVLGLPVGMPAALPFAACGEAPSAAAPQPRSLHLLDDLLRGHLKEGLRQGPVSPYGYIVLDRLGIYQTVRAEDEAHLPLVEGDVLLIGDGFPGLGVLVQEPLYDPAAFDGLGDDFGYVLGFDPLVEDPLRFHHHQRPSFAEAVAAGGLGLDACPALEFLPQGLQYL